MLSFGFTTHHQLCQLTVGNRNHHGWDASLSIHQIHKQDWIHFEALTRSGKYIHTLTIFFREFIHLFFSVTLSQEDFFGWQFLVAITGTAVKDNCALASASSRGSCCIVKSQNPFPNSKFKNFKSVLVFLYFKTGCPPFHNPYWCLNSWEGSLFQEAICCRSFLWSMKNNFHRARKSITVTGTPLITDVLFHCVWVVFFHISAALN